MNKYWHHESEDSYHARSKNGDVLSSHILLTYMDSPLLYYRTIKGLITEKPSSAFAFGTAAHKMILEGRETFNTEYVVSDGPINPKTGEVYGKQTKAYSEWLATQDRKVLSPADFDLINTMYNRVQDNTVARELLSAGDSECVVRCDVSGIPCQIRIDWLNPEKGIVDLKTTAELRWFENDIKRYGYALQLAFYRKVVFEATGKVLPVRIIAVEKTEPYAAGVWQLSRNLLDMCETRLMKAIERLKESKANNHWPTGYETERMVTE